jgi:hypothetical protein
MTSIDDFQRQVELAGPLSCPKQEFPYLLGTILAFQFSSQPVSGGSQIANVWESTYRIQAERALKKATRRWLFPLARVMDITRRIWIARCMYHNAPSEMLKEAILGGACFECFDADDKHAYTVYEQFFTPMAKSESGISFNLDNVSERIRPSEYETLESMVQTVEAAIADANHANNEDSPHSGFLLRLLGSIAFDGSDSEGERTRHTAIIRRVVKATVGGCDVQRG